MKKFHAFILFMLLAGFASGQSAPSPSCEFTVAAKVCTGQEVKIVYVGGAPQSATYVWNFDSAVVISGNGQGPYYVQWPTPGEKHVNLHMSYNGATCTLTKPVVVVTLPALFHMTGGGMVVPGGQGVPVGLSGSQTGIVYKLRLNGQYCGVTVTGTGQPVSFGAVTVPGHYTAVAKVDGSDCLREMEGVAVVTGQPPVPAVPICMVTFDTLSGRNKIIWNKPPSAPINHFNIFRETYQNNVFTKIAEVPYTSPGIFIDTTSDPLVRTDRFKLSVTDSAGHESEKSPHHKTIHLNMNPGIFGFNLIWNHYEGFEFKTYRIHRKFTGGPWTAIDSVASNVDSYTDFYITPGVTTYYIEVLRLEPCNPSLKSSGYASLISNTAAAAPLGIGEDATSGIMVYPNPVKDRLVVSVRTNGLFKAELMRLDGKRVLEKEFNGPLTELQLGEMPAGLYFLRISGNTTSVVMKIIRS